MDENQLQEQPAVARPFSRVLNAGSGPPSNQSLHPLFRPDAWAEVRFDIDASAKPDFVGSITEMGSIFYRQSFDAVWSSHTLEHLHRHQILTALTEFRRVLKPTGFALITCPDLEAIASLILTQGPDAVSYISPAGPITPLDMLFGHSESIARGKLHMAHNTGFTCASLGQKLTEAGFPIVYARREALSLWALALMEESDQETIRLQLLATGLDLFDGPIQGRLAAHT